MEKIIQQFIGKKKAYDRLKVSLLSLIPTIIEEYTSIEPHLITGRVKGESSLRDKIARKDNKYNSIDEITDIVGVRIITYLESDVDSIAEIIKKEFTVDSNNSIDKRIITSNKFGYKSLHYIVTINESRCKHIEYKKYKDVKFEIQIRSILQHAWAEIEHDLGYKSSVEVPDALIRNFSRLSALLEIADIEFDRLKNELLNYKTSVQERILSAPATVGVDKISLEALYDSDSVIQEARKIVMNRAVKYNHIDGTYTTIITGFEFFNLSTIDEIEKSLIKEKEKYLCFVNTFCTRYKDKIMKGVAYKIEFTYFHHYLASKSEDVNNVVKYFNNCGYGFSHNHIRDAEEYIEIYKSCSIVGEGGSVSH